MAGFTLQSLNQAVAPVSFVWRLYRLSLEQLSSLFIKVVSTATQDPGQ
jgi:hypothetical protein